MGPWGFVFLAYGIVWSALALYLTLLRGRRRKAQAEIDKLRSTQDGNKNGQK